MLTKKNSSDPARSAGRVPAGVLICLLGCGAGCQQLGAAIAVIKGGETLPAEYRLGAGPLAIFVDDVEQLGIPPEALGAFHDTLVEDFQKYDVNKHVAPLADVNRLKLSESKFDDLSIRQIGEKVGAEQVLYVRVNYWALKETPGDPQFRGRFSVSIKVCTTQAPKPEDGKSVRLWPTDREYQSVEVTTRPDLNEAVGAETQVARELATKMAVAVGRLFHEHKTSRRLDANSD